MDYQYSTVIDPSEYETEGLCDGIEVRMHRQFVLEDRGAIRCHHDWSANVAPVTRYRGTVGPRYSFISVTVPECLPDRLEIAGYCNEFAFLHDDITDHVDQDLGTVENDDMMEAFLEGARTAAIDHANDAEGRQLGKRRVQAQVLHEMLAIDRECALVTMKSWARFLEVGSSRQHDTRFASLEAYLPYRIMDVGEMFWYGLVTFCMGLKIPDHEMDTCRRLMAPAWIAVGLQNDLYSWPKERDAAARLGQGHVVNALWVMMQEHGFGIDEAQAMCRTLIKRYVAQYVQIVKDSRHDMSLSQDLRRYIEAMQYSISGNVVWSLTCPRYNPDVCFSPAQLHMMEHGVPPLAAEQAAPPCSSPPARLSSIAIYVDASSSEASSSPQSPNSSLNSPNQFDPPMSAAGGLDKTATELLSAPFEYISSLPSKGMRERFIDGLNEWLQVPREKMAMIKEVVGMLHNSSLLLDDFQDGSPLRRGKPAAHTIFGPAQAINSAGFFIIKAIDTIQRFCDPEGVRFATEKIMSLYTGQGLDLYWTYNGVCPSVSEYERMIDGKTGAMFALASGLMVRHSSLPAAQLGGLDDAKGVATQLQDMTMLLGRYFQIADDYKNLTNADYTKQKGFCEDLDEGKYSLPLIYLLQRQPENFWIRNILSTRRLQHQPGSHGTGMLTHEQKLFVVDMMRESKCLEYTKVVLEGLYEDVGQQIEGLEARFGRHNPQIKLMWHLLHI